MLEHLSAGFFALAAFFGAFFHVLILKLGAFRTAAAAGFRTGGADEVGEHTLPGRDARGGGTMVGTIQTRAQGGFVFFFPLGEQVPTMRCTGIAGSLTIAASFGAMLKGMSMMLVAGRCRLG